MGQWLLYVTNSLFWIVILLLLSCYFYYTYCTLIALRIVTSYFSSEALNDTWQRRLHAHSPNILGCERNAVTQWNTGVVSLGMRWMCCVCGRKGRRKWTLATTTKILIISPNPFSSSVLVIKDSNKWQPRLMTTILRLPWNLGAILRQHSGQWAISKSIYNF